MARLTSRRYEAGGLLPAIERCDERGLAPDERAVTLVAAEGPHQVTDHNSNTPPVLLNRLNAPTQELRDRSAGPTWTHPAPSLWKHLAPALDAASQASGGHGVVSCPEYGGVPERARGSRADVRHSLAGRVAPLTADDLFVLAAGGEAGGFSAIIPPWASGRGSLPVTLAVGMTGAN